MLSNLLIQEDPAYIVTRTTLDDNGFELRRLLRKPLGETKRQTMIAMLMRIALQKIDDNRIIEHLTK